ncbi:hypothetical protein HELRODRAFT_83507 [Helobdella robusta]|uniref:Phosphoserine phosphatase n=1 Tax=Helobdella robusta TaxID=6412 RepID=T1G565_HELRO|nr:hypothetical protein HELRODRAFT_83507 [Helobdella robusta]ESN99947.1 hypothetical protein HELRODRAFT_83507 [Helobdella robusta]
MDVARVKLILKNCDCVTIDVDSTICCDETVDELAKFWGKEDAIVPITTLAMEGHLDFRTALEKRMEVLDISSQKLKVFIAEKKIQYTPNVKKFIKFLQNRCIAVYLITGGFHETVDNIAIDLNIPLENVFANRIIFDETGRYLGVDETELTLKDNVKAEVIKGLKCRFNYKSVVHIGDGMNDAKVCPVADAFVGYGGVVIRQKVKELAGWFVTDFQQLIDEMMK